MYEVENNVRVSVSGPKKEIEMYIHWLKCTEEYQLKSGFRKNIPASCFSLTDFNAKEDMWKFTSTDMKHQIKAFDRWNLKELNYQVNYMVYYEPLTFSNDNMSSAQESGVDTGVFAELVNAFNPIPPMLAVNCPNLQIEVKWSSFYLNNPFPKDFYGNDQVM